MLMLSIRCLLVAISQADTNPVVQVETSADGGDSGHTGAGGDLGDDNGESGHNDGR